MTTPDADAAEAITTIGDAQSRYRDGGEERVLEIITNAPTADLAASSAALLAQAVGWAERYHVDPARANVLRALDLPADAVVLEIGAGCGAVTRYLGETVARVDAVEPAPWRAEVARARTRDLTTVNVFVGEVSDLPDTPVYDLVVVVGVLEYVGAGALEDSPYLAFLDECVRRLRPGGSLVVAIENQLGAKYLAGAPEDHYGLPQVGLQGYAGVDGLARTFSRAELTALLDAAGTTSRPLIAFPDYKVTRAVFDPVGFGDAPARELLVTVPSFPSPDWVGVRAAGADERMLWSTLVRAGLAADTGNSFVVLAHRPDETPAALWAEGRAGTFFSRDRLPAFGMTTTIDRDGDGFVVRKTPQAAPAEPADDADDVFVIGSQQEFVPGLDLIEALIAADEARARTLIERWADLVTRTVPQTGSFDLLPHNVRVDAADDLVVIDDEWHRREPAPVEVLRRGVLLTALLLAPLRDRIEWAAQARTGRAIAEVLGAWAGLDPRLDWLDEALDTEARFQEAVLVKSGENSADGFGERRAAIVAALAVEGPPTADEERRALDQEELDRAAWEESERRAREAWEAEQEQARIAWAAEQAAAAAEAETLRRRLALGEAALVRLDSLEKEMADQLHALEIENRQGHERLDEQHRRHVAEIESRNAQRIHDLERTEAELRGILAISRKSLIKRVLKRIR